MTGLFDPVLVYALTLLRRFCVFAGFACLLMYRFTGNVYDGVAAAVALTVALLLMTVRRR